MLTPQTTTGCNLSQVYKGSAWFPNYFALESLRFPGRHIRHQVSFLERTLSLHSDTALSPFPAGLCLLTGLWQCLTNDYSPSYGWKGWEKAACFTLQWLLEMLWRVIPPISPNLPPFSIDSRPPLTPPPST